MIDRSVKRSHVAAALAAVAVLVGIYAVAVDATRIDAGAKAVLGTIHAGAFPREMRVTPDGKTLLLTNFRSKTLELVDLERLPLTPVRPTAR